jgi:hypothetical protein
LVCSFNWQIHKWGNLQIVVSLPLSFVENNIEKGPYYPVKDEQQL